MTEIYISTDVETDGPIPVSTPVKFEQLERRPRPNQDVGEEELDGEIADAQRVRSPAADIAPVQIVAAKLRFSERFGLTLGEVKKLANRAQI